MNTTIQYIWEATDWTSGVKSATSIQELTKFVDKWSPFVWDAKESVSKMIWKEWISERDKAYRKNGKPSVQWMEKYGAIVMPENLITAEMVSIQFKAPLGVCLIRLYEIRPDMLRGIE